MGEAALGYLIGFFGGLEDAPAERSEGGAEVARSLRASPPELGGSFDDVFEDFRLAAEHSFESRDRATWPTSPGAGCSRPRWPTS